MKHKKVGIWVRVSSTMQVDRDSHIHHEMRAKEYVKSRGWKAVKIYRLEAMSGRSIAKYDETKRMLNDIQKGVISGLIFSKIPRLARNTKELIELSEVFRKYDADLISLDMSIDTSTPIGRHFFRQMSSLAEWELENIADRVASSVKVRAKLGKHIGGQAPYGFKYVDKKLVPDENEAPIRKLMFELFLEHKRKRTVASILNERGHRTKKGNKFTDSTVKRLLTDPVSKGLHIMNRRYSSSKKPNQFKPESEWVFHEVEPIVSKELFDEVNRIIKEQKRSHTPVLNTKVHLFTGFIFCHCGSRMYTRYNTKSYTCANCCGNRIDKDDLEEVFRSQLYSYSASQENVDTYFNRVHVIINDKQKEYNNLKKEQERLNKHIEGILLLHTEGKIKTEAFHTYHQKPYEQLKQVESTLEELEMELTVHSVGKKSTEEVITIAKNLYEKWPELGHNEKRSIIETITNKIIIGIDTIDIKLFKLLPDGYHPSLSELETNGQHTLDSMMWRSKGSFCN